MASKLAAFEQDILRMVLAGRSYASIGKFLVEHKKCKTDGPAIYRWLKSRQRKLLARQALVNPTSQVVDPQVSYPMSAEVSSAVVFASPVSPAKSTVQAKKGTTSTALDFDKLMSETKETRSILGKKR